MKNNIEEVLEYFPSEIKIKINNNISKNLEEIRLRTNRNIFLKIGQVEYEIEHEVSTKEILEILQRICDNSIYTYQSQICNGYITIKGRPSCGNYRKCSYKRWTSN